MLTCLHKKINLTKQLYQIIYDLKLQRNIFPDINRVVEVVAETLSINPDEKLKNELKKHLAAFKRLNEANRHISFDEKLNELVSLIVLDSINFSVVKRLLMWEEKKRLA